MQAHFARVYNTKKINMPQETAGLHSLLIVATEMNTLMCHLRMGLTVEPRGGKRRTVCATPYLKFHSFKPEVSTWLHFKLGHIRRCEPIGSINHRQERLAFVIFSARSII